MENGERDEELKNKDVNPMAAGLILFPGEEITSANPMDTNVKDKSPKCYMLETVVAEHREWKEKIRTDRSLSM